MIAHPSHHREHRFDRYRIRFDEGGVGHGRQAALGDAICNLYQTQGWAVYREFYYNDAGVQIATLAASTQARLRGLAPTRPCLDTAIDALETAKEVSSRPRP